MTIAITKEEPFYPLQAPSPEVINDNNVRGWSPASLMGKRKINPSQRPLIDNIHPLMEIIDEFADYGSDWDSYDAPPFDSIVLERAKSMIIHLSSHGVPSPNLIPASSGAIIFDWRTQFVHLEIHIDPEQDDLVYISDHELAEDFEYIGPLDEISNGYRQILSRALGLLIYTG